MTMRWATMLDPITIRGLRRLRVAYQRTGRKPYFASILRSMVRAELARLAESNPELGELASWPDWQRPIGVDFPKHRRPSYLTVDEPKRRAPRNSPPAADALGMDDMDDLSEFEHDGLEDC